jgi:hypothetical protein
MKLNNGTCKITVRKLRFFEFQNIVDRLFSDRNIQSDYDSTRDSTDNVDI